MYGYTKECMIIVSVKDRDVFKKTPWSFALNASAFF